MRRIVLGLMSLLIAFSAHAQVPKKGLKVEKTVTCFPLKTLLNDLSKKYQEEPMLFGMSGVLENVIVGVYINKDTGSYTIIEFDEEVGCIVSVGDRIRYRFPKIGATL